MNYSVIPYVVGEFLVADWSDGGARDFQDVQLLPTNPIDIEVSQADLARATRSPQGRRAVIVQQLRELVSDAVEVAMNDGISHLLEGINESPPIKIVRGQFEPLEDILAGSTFEIVGINGVPLNYGAGRERVFKQSHPDIRYDTTKYFKPDKSSMLLTDTGDTASCAFQYLHQRFGKKKGYIKLARDFKTIKRIATKEPPQFKNWARHYRDELNIEKMGFNIQNGLPDLESFEMDLVKVVVPQLKDDIWTDEEIHNSLSVLDIIRWCMWASVSCYVIDYDGNYYLSYNHNNIVRTHTDKSTGRESVVLKVRDNHAYFVDDVNLKQSVSQINTNWRNQEFEEIGRRFKKDKYRENKAPPEKPKVVDPETGECHSCCSRLCDCDNYDAIWDWEKQVKEWIKENQADIYYSPFHRFNDAVTNHKIDPRDLSQELMSIDKTIEEDGWKECVAEIVEQKSKLCPPPLPEEFLKDEDKSYYLQSKHLNGIVDYIANHYDVYPTNMKGSSAHSIDKVTYGKTRLFSRNCMPYRVIPNADDLELIRTKFPDLSLKRLPTYSQIAMEIFKSKYSTKPLESIYSMFNSNTRRAFIDGEIKADNRVVKETIDTEWAVSIDLNLAYTSAMDDMDVDWNVFDGMCQFKKYGGVFNPSYFYLVKEIATGYPMRGGKNLKLYHGCFLRHLRDKVTIEYEIRPVRSFEPGYFKEFVKDCEELEYRCWGDGCFRTKFLVNTFIGDLKKDNKITGYTHAHTESSTTATRAYWTGGIISAIDKNTRFNREYRWNKDTPTFLISKPSMEFNIQTGQPIRLQVMDKINENLYQLYHLYKSCLGFNKDPKLAMVRTDALYFEKGEDLKIDEAIEEVIKKAPFACSKERLISKEDWDCKISDKEDNGVRMEPNKWKNEISIDKAWSEEIGAKLLMRLLVKQGGLVKGEAGVGKSTLLNTIDDGMKKNRIRYKWYKLYLKLTENDYWFQELEDWRDENPCFCLKLAPTNKAANKISGKTFNKGLGIPLIGVEEEDDEEDTGASDVTQLSYFETIIARLAGCQVTKKPVYDIIFVDEISMINGYYWSLLHYIKDRIPRIKFILAGDIERQLPPVRDERDFKNSYLIKVLSNSTKLELNHNFRSGDVGNILWDEWSVKPDVFQVVPTNPDTIRNLCYTNLKRKEVINTIQNKMKVLPHIILRKRDYYPPLKEFKNDEQTDELVIGIGTPLIANKSLSELGIAKNDMYSVSSYTGEVISLFNDSENRIELSYEEVYKHFYSGYCITIHKAQGETYDDKYTIHEWDKLSKHFPIARRLRYVAQSRSKDPENNIFYK